MSRILHDAVRMLAVSTARVTLLVLALMWVSSVASAHSGHHRVAVAQQASILKQKAFLPILQADAGAQAVCRLVRDSHADGATSARDVSFADLQNHVHTASASSCCGVSCHGAFHDVVFAVRAPSMKSQRITIADPHYSWSQVRFGLIRPPNA